MRVSLFGLGLLLLLSGCRSSGPRFIQVPADQPFVGGPPLIANAQSEKPHLDVNELEFLIQTLVNEQRTLNRVRPVVWDPNLHVLAKAHSRDMGVHSYFSHVNRAGENPSQRGARSGYVCRKQVGDRFMEGIGENLFQLARYGGIQRYDFGEGRIQEVYLWLRAEEIAEKAVIGWMNSSGHRKNILNPGYEKAAIGIYITDDELIYITHNFC